LSPIVLVTRQQQAERMYLQALYLKKAEGALQKGNNEAKAKVLDLAANARAGKIKDPALAARAGSGKIKE
jgi:hypothetical protein